MYKNVFDALFRIIKEEGLFTLWRGAIPTMGRAMVVNAAQLASYSQAKQALLDTGKLMYYLRQRKVHTRVTFIRNIKRSSLSSILMFCFVFI